MNNKYLREQFALLDTNQDGFLDLEEIRKALNMETVGSSKNDKRLTITEFQMAILELSEFKIHIRPTFQKLA